MHPELLARSISGVSSETTPKLFRIRARIVSEPVAERVLDFLSNNGIGTASGSKILFSKEDKLEIAILALKMGCDIEQISIQLNWKDFEALTSKILKLSGYKTAIHVIFSKPRMEIDVVGINSKFALRWIANIGNMVAYQFFLCMQKNKRRGQKFYLQKEIIFPLQYL